MINLLAKIILTPLFFLVLTPLGLMLRWSGVDLVNRNVNKPQKTYWQSVDPGNPARLKPGTDKPGFDKSDSDKPR